MRFYRTATTAGSVRFYAPLRNADGSNSAPSYSFTNDTDTGMYSAAADTIGFSTAGTARWSLNGTGQFVPATSGNYDIGTTSSLVRNIYSNEFRGENGLVSSPSFTFRTDLDTGMYLGSTGILKFSTAGADRLVVSGTSIENYTVGSGYGWQARYVSGTNNPGIFIENNEAGNYSRLVQSSSPGSGSLYLGVDGINTLHVTTTEVRNLLGSSSAPSYTFQGDTNTGFYSPSADRFALTAGGSVYLSSELQSTYGYLKITEGAGGTVATLGTTSWSRTWYMGKNLRYNKTGATSSPYDRLNWEYISGDTSSSQMGSLLISGSNGIAAWDFYAVPITTGAGVIPASFTRICRIATNGTTSTGGQIQMTDGASTAPAYSFTNDTDAGMRITQAGNVRISAATDGTFLDVDSVNSRINTNRYLNISESRNELLVLNQASATGSPYIAWKQNGTRRMYLQYNNSDAHTYLVNENGGTIELQTTADEILTLRVANTTGDPYITLANQDGPKGYWQSLDNGTTYLGTAVANAATHIRDFGNSSNIASFDYNGTDTVTLNSVNNAALAINHTSATGQPLVRFKQSGTDRARVQYINSGQMRFRLEGNTDDFTFYAGGATSATDLRLHFNGLGDDLGRWAVENSQFYVEEDQTVLTVAATVTCDWDRSNQLHLTITNTVTTIAIDDNSMFPGGSYILMVQEGTSAPSSVTWSSTDTIFWANGTAPVLNGGDLNDITVVQFFKTTAGSNTRIIGSWFLAQ
jgi:hypothetical protein